MQKVIKIAGETGRKPDRNRILQKSSGLKRTSLVKGKGLPGMMHMVGLILAEQASFGRAAQQAFDSPVKTDVLTHIVGKVKQFN